MTLEKQLKRFGFLKSISLAQKVLFLNFHPDYDIYICVFVKTEI